MTADKPNAPSPDEAAPETGTPTPSPKHGYLRRHWIGVTVAVLIGLPALVFTVWAGVALSFSYSSGTRTGFVQKLSRKGWVCKTWEGEMAMTAQPGVAPTLFAFTVRLDSVANEVTKLEGRQVTLTYDEHKGVPSSCFGETGHYVKGVSAVPR
jgi:hypothetical protein